MEAGVSALSAPRTMTKRSVEPVGAAAIGYALPGVSAVFTPRPAVA
jgi:hypothetical protein